MKNVFAPIISMTRFIYLFFVVVIIFLVGIGLIVKILPTNVLNNLNYRSPTKSLADPNPFLDTPTPIVSFTLKQQCSNDATMYENRVNQEANNNQQVALRQGHQSQFSYSLNTSSYNKKLNTCLAILAIYGSYDGKIENGEEIVDTISGKTLAQKIYNDDSLNFTYDKSCLLSKTPCVVSSSDYEEYKSSIGF